MHALLRPTLRRLTALLAVPRTQTSCSDAPQIGECKRLQIPLKLAWAITM